MSNSLQPQGPYSPWNSPGQNPAVGSLSLLLAIVPTQGSNPGIPHCRWILYQLSHKRSPRTLEWVAYPFSRGSSRPRNWTRVSCIAGKFFTNWVTIKILWIYTYMFLSCSSLDYFHFGILPSSLLKMFFYMDFIDHPIHMILYDFAILSYFTGSPNTFVHVCRLIW